MSDSFDTTPANFLETLEYFDKNTALALGSSSAPAPIINSGLTSNITSREIQDQVLQLYAVFFGRGADKSGLDHWSNLIASGYSLSEVSRDFAISPEWTSQYSNLTPSQQIEHFYQNAFNRSADASGQNNWQSVMNAGVPFYEVARMIVNAGFAGGAGVGAQDTATIRATVDAFRNFSDPLATNTPAVQISNSDSKQNPDLATNTPAVQISGGTVGNNTSSGSSANSDSTPNPEPVLAGALTFSASAFTESAANDGSVSSPIIITLANDTFSAAAASLIATANVPDGLTAHFVRISDTTLSFTLTGNATHHANINDANNLSVTFQDNAFTKNLVASSVNGYTKSNMTIDFSNGSTSGEDGSGGGSGGSSGGDSNNGDLYGDQYVLLRDLDPANGGGNGQPVLDANGQVIAIGSDGTPIYFVQNVDGDYEIPADKIELVQTVELERANVARAPESVMNKSLLAAMEKINAAEVVETDPSGRIVCDGATIDSPLENLALYKYLMTAGNASSWPDVMDAWPEKIRSLAGDSSLNPDWSPASLLGAAVSKESPISMDAVIYESTTLGVNTVTQIDGVQNIDYFQFNNGTTETFNYDRASHYANVWLQWYAETDGDLNNLELVKDTLMNAVFNNQNWQDQYIAVSSNPAEFVQISATTSGLNDFAQAAEDTRAIINFMHESYGAVQTTPPLAEATVIATLSAVTPPSAETAADQGLAGAGQELAGAGQDLIGADLTRQQDGTISLSDLIEDPREGNDLDPNQIDLASVTQPSEHSDSVLDGDTDQQTTSCKNSPRSTSCCEDRVDVTAYATVDTVTLTSEHTLAG